MHAPSRQCALLVTQIHRFIKKGAHLLACRGSSVGLLDSHSMRDACSARLAQLKDRFILGCHTQKWAIAPPALALQGSSRASHPCCRHVGNHVNPVCLLGLLNAAAAPSSAPPANMFRSLHYQKACTAAPSVSMLCKDELCKTGGPGMA